MSKYASNILNHQPNLAIVSALPWNQSHVLGRLLFRTDQSLEARSLTGFGLDAGSWNSATRLPEEQLVREHTILTPTM